MRVDPDSSVEAVDRRVAAEVRAEIARQGLSQNQFADKLGWPQSKLWRRLGMGEARPVTFSVGELVVVADVLGVPVSQLLPAEVTA